MDAIDLAILEYSKTLKSKFDDYQQVSYRPFNPASKTTEAIVSFKENNFRIIKGATQIIISMCKDLDKETLAGVNKTIDGFSQKGSRTIAVAISAGDENNDFKFVGVIAIADPSRENSKIMIAAIHDLGIKIIMLTGDRKAIAQEIAQQVGIAYEWVILMV